MNGIVFAIFLAVLQRTTCMYASTLPPFILAPYKHYHIDTGEVESLFAAFVKEYMHSPPNKAVPLLNRHRQSILDRLPTHLPTLSLAGQALVDRMKFMVQEGTFLRILGAGKLPSVCDDISVQGLTVMQSCLMRSLFEDINQTVMVFARAPMAISIGSLACEDVIDFLQCRLEHLLNCSVILYQTVGKGAPLFGEKLVEVFEFVRSELRDALVTSVSSILKANPTNDKVILQPVKVKMTVEEWFGRVKSVINGPLLTVNTAPADLLEQCSSDELLSVFTSVNTFRHKLRSLDAAQLLSHLKSPDSYADSKKVNMWTWFLKTSTVLGISDCAWSMHVDMSLMVGALHEWRCDSLLLHYLHIQSKLFSKRKTPPIMSIMLSSLPSAVPIVHKKTAIDLFCAEQYFFALPEYLFGAPLGRCFGGWMALGLQDLAVLDLSLHVFLREIAHCATIGTISNRLDDKRMMLLDFIEGAFPEACKSFKVRLFMGAVLQSIHSSSTLLPVVLHSQKLISFPSFARSKRRESGRLTQAGLWGIMSAGCRQCARALLQMIRVECGMMAMFGGADCVDVLPYVSRIVERHGRGVL